MSFLPSICFFFVRFFILYSLGFHYFWRASGPNCSKIPYAFSHIHVKANPNVAEYIFLLIYFYFNVFLNASFFLLCTYLFQIYIIKTFCFVWNWIVCDGSSVRTSSNRFDTSGGHRVQYVCAKVQSITRDESYAGHAASTFAFTRTRWRSIHPSIK